MKLMEGLVRPLEFLASTVKGKPTIRLIMLVKVFYLCIVVLGRYIQYRKYLNIFNVITNC